MARLHYINIVTFLFVSNGVTYYISLLPYYSNSRIGGPIQYMTKLMTIIIENKLSVAFFKWLLKRFCKERDSNARQFIKNYYGKLIDLLLH